MEYISDSVSYLEVLGQTSQKFLAHLSFMESFSRTVLMENIVGVLGEAYSSNVNIV